MIFRGVEYSPAGEDLLRALAKRWHATDDADEKAALNREAQVVHAFHAEFPGLVVHDSGREPMAAAETPGDVTSLATVSQAEEPASRPETLFEDVA